MSKKIFSLVLAVIMLFSVCAIAVSAEVAEGATVGIRVESDAKVGDPKDTVVTISVYYDLPEGEEFQMAASKTAIAWDSTKFKLNSTSTSNAKDAHQWGDAYADYFKTPANVTCSSSVSGKIVALFDDVDTANNWNAGCQVQQTYNTENASGAEGFPIHSGEVVFTLSFVALDVIEEGDVIGVSHGAYNSSYSAINQWTGSNKYACVEESLVDFSAAVAAPAAAPATPDVYELDQKTRAYEKSEGVYKTATFFGFKTIAPDFNAAGTSQYITDITAQVTIDGTPVAANDIPVIRYVYDLGNGEYGFRVILDNIADGDAVITVTPVVTTTDSKTFNVETVTFTAATAEAV